MGSFQEDVPELVGSYIPEKGKILEVGCGPGDVAIKLARKSKNVIYGVDSSKSAISKARKKLSNLGDIFFKVMKAEDLDFSDNFFNLVYSVWTLHETKAEKSLKEAYRVLKSGGVLLVMDWIKEEAKSWGERSFDFEELNRMLTSGEFEYFNVEIKNGHYELIAEK